MENLQQHKKLDTFTTFGETLRDSSIVPLQGPFRRHRH